MAGTGYVQVPPDSTGKQVDMVSATVGGVSVARQVMALANGADGQTIAEVVGASASTGAVGVVVRPTTATVALVTDTSVGINSIGTVTVTGSIGINSISGLPAVAISGTAVVTGVVNISAMPTVTVTGGVAVSGTATVAGVVGLTAGTAVIGDLNAISRTVQVAIGTPYTLQGISTTVQVAVGTPFVIQGISTTVLVAGNLSVGSFLDRGSATASQASVTLIGGVFDDAYPALSSSLAGIVKVTSARAMHVQLRSNAGTTFDDTAGTALRVNVVAGGTGGGTVTLSSGTVTRISNTVAVAIATPYILQGISTTVQVAVATPYIIQGISTTVQVAVGTPFTVNNISATTIVAGVVSLGAGTANIGTLNDISRTVQVAIATPYILQGISTTVTVAGVVSLTAATTIGINSISATVSVALTGVSAGVAINTQARAPAVMSASRGPKCVTASTSANVTLIASPGAGANIYIKQLGVHNFSGTFVAMRVGTSASLQTVVVAAQSSGGGAIYNFDPPWMLSASEAALCSVKPNANYGVFNVQFYVI